MNTTKTQVATKPKTQLNTISIDGWFNKQAENFEKSRFGWMAMYITAQSCLGSIASLYILQNNASDVFLVLCAVITMVCNAIFIAQGPGKWCIASFYLSVFANSLFIINNI